MGQKENNQMGQNERTRMGQETNLPMGQKTSHKNGSSTNELPLQPLWKLLFALSLPKIDWKTTIHVSHIIYLILGYGSLGMVPE